MPPVRIRARSSRALRSRALAVGVVALALVAGACVPPKKGPPPPAPLPPLPSQYCHPSTPTSASGYQAAFNGLFNSNAKGWAASDGGHPVALPGGRILWMYGDTLVGRRAADGSIQGDWQLPSNGFVLQNGRCFTPITHPIPGSIWPVGAMVRGSQLWVFGMRVQSSSPFGGFAGAVVARFSLPGLSHLGTQNLPLPVANRRYGATVGFDNDFVYAYGYNPNPDFPLVRRHYVARAPRDGNLFTAGSWQFWATTVHAESAEVGVEVHEEVWEPDPILAQPMLFDSQDGEGLKDIGPGAAFSVAPSPSSTKYVGAAFPVDAFTDPNDKIQTWQADGAGGPWTLHADVAVRIRDFHGPRAYPPWYAYGGRVVFGLPGSPFGLWSTNRTNFNDVLADPTRYKVWYAPPRSGSIP